MRLHAALLTVVTAGIAFATPAVADTFSFSTGITDGLIATATRPASAGKFEIESADDFVISSPTAITHATFTGLITGTTPVIGQVVVEIYRVFPADSDVGRTSGPPTFSTPNVPTRVNSPSDVALDDRDSVAGTLTVTTTGVQSTFTANNSVQPGGIHPLPGIFTGGDLAVTGAEVLFDVTFNTPFDLLPGHYFFVPQVQVAGGEFLWLSAPRPIVAPGTPFPPGATDLQSWTRDGSGGGIDPDWLRIGTDITHQGPFNAVFSLDGNIVPEPSTLLLLGMGMLAMGFTAVAGWRRLSLSGSSA